jgi:hypothetical protein
MRLSLIPCYALFASLSVVAQPIPDFTPPSPLFAAASRNDTAEVKRLLAAGANPNEGRFIGFTPTFFAAIRNNPEMLKALADKGADVRAVDGAGSSILMWAAANEAGSTPIIEALLKLGADPNQPNKLGETALTWAQRRGHTPAVEALLKVTTAKTDANKLAVERAVALMQKSGPQFVRVSGCASCHHQSLPQMAIGAARERGYAVNETVSKQEVASVVNLLKMMRPAMDQQTDQIPDIPITIPYLLMGLHAEGYPADEHTTSAANLVRAKQRSDGSFPSMPARPPIESSDITATALSIRAMQLYGQQMESSIAKAGKWLLASRPVNTEELSMRLMGLAWAQADTTEIKRAAKALLDEQRPEGGWGQMTTLESDAYATGQALYALHQSGQMTTSDVAYQRGAGFLLRTQFNDGSWLVRSRAFPLQQIRDSGFPHGKDQWISASGTGWAALALSLPSPVKPHESSGND